MTWIKENSTGMPADGMINIQRALIDVEQT